MDGTTVRLEAAADPDLVGGKAARLGEMLRAGFRVPPGFCLTTRAHEIGTVPDDELFAAHARLGAGPVAVRSSGTGEDLPRASGAGQQDSVLGVDRSELAEAVRRCWESLESDRAAAYRRASGIGSARMAVVVQRMVDPAVAGVLFTANPVTGCRDEMVVDAAPGLGTAVVDGTTTPDHHVLNGRSTAEGGCLSRRQLAELEEVGGRLQEHFGAPQDVEWAFDRDGVLWLLQSRPITTLFPLPERSEEIRAYLETGHLQGMLQPITPAGFSAIQRVTALWRSAHGAGTARRPAMTDIGGRLYLDISDVLRSKHARRSLVTTVRFYAPRCERLVELLLEDPRFAPRPGLPVRPGTVLRMTARILPEAVVGLARALARPESARERAFRGVGAIRQRSEPPELHTAEDRLRFAEDVQQTFAGPEMFDVLAPLATGALAAQASKLLLAGVATASEVDTALGGLPHNVTTEMDLALWRIAARLDGESRALLANGDPADLAAEHRAGTLPDIGLDEFLGTYGRRCASEVDIGTPRWSEDPAPVFATLANYLRITDPEQAPDRRFERAAARAEEAIDDLVHRARTKSWLRGRLVGFFLRRTRQLGGLRELAKFAWLHPLAEMRQQLLEVGAELVVRGVLDNADDIMFLDLGEMSAAFEQVPHRELVRERRTTHERELARRHVPGVLLSDGTDLEAAAPPDDLGSAITGTGVSPGRATGRARVARDPRTAHIEPGEILVAPTTDPGWTPLFLSAAGLVGETGSAIAHGPTVAREYGLPAVVGVRSATERLTTGQLITIDGAAGTVTVHEQDSTTHE
jgi:pyruvate,water dikinase